MKNLSSFALLPFCLTLMMTETAKAEDGSDLVTLNPVIATGTAAEALKYDPIIPAYSGKTKARASTGNIIKEISNDLPFHSSANLRPGNEAGFVGIGKGTEETDVNVLGIPLNRAQGGGSDLATFPQFFWSGYNYQIGPSLGAFDPRGVGGSLTLRLWTQDQLGTEGYRATAFHSTRQIQQFSLGHSSKDFAALIGMTTGDVFGPAISFSGVAMENGATKITTHLLFSDTKVDGFFSDKTPTTRGTQRTDRLIPVVQIDRKLEAGKLIKSTFFYDFTFADYDVETQFRKKQIKRTHQIGNETALIMGDTRIGLGLRNTSYKREAATAIENIPQEQTVNVQATHTFRTGSFKFEPTVGGTAVTRLGFFPYVTVGGRHESELNGGKIGAFVRAGYHRRFPSLLDRYYEFIQSAGPGLVIVLPNAGLRPENVRSTEVGTDYTNGDYRTQLTAFARDYQHARYTSVTTSGFNSYYQIQNAGNAYVFGFTHSNDMRVLPVLDLGTRVTYQRSKIYDLGSEFPYSPRWVGILRADIHDAENRFGLEVANKVASHFYAYGESSSSGATELPSYYYMDLTGRARVTPELTLTAGVENLFDREIQYQSSTPSEGRVYSLSATANF